MLPGFREAPTTPRSPLSREATCHWRLPFASAWNPICELPASAAARRLVPTASLSWKPTDIHQRHDEGGVKPNNNRFRRLGDGAEFYLVTLASSFPSQGYAHRKRHAW